MKLYNPKFWKYKNIISFSLLPLSLITQLFVLFKIRFTKVSNFKIPIICVGNIYIGGTGKTPLSILIGKELSKLGKNPVIIRKYYKMHNDEYSLIKENFGNLIMNSKRVLAIKEAENKNFDTVILDDGLQDYKINKDLSIICFNSNLDGNGFILPAGPLRESLVAVKNAQFLIINGKKNLEFEKKILDINKTIKIYYSKYKPVNLEKFKQKKLLVIAGIGNPKSFLELLERYNLDVVKKYIFPDHYAFSKDEINRYVSEAKKNDYHIILTEKDYHRVKEFNLEKIDYLKVELVIKEKENLIREIQRVYD